MLTISELITEPEAKRSEHGDIGVYVPVRRRDLGPTSELTHNEYWDKIVIEWK